MANLCSLQRVNYSVLDGYLGIRQTLDWDHLHMLVVLRSSRYFPRVVVQEGLVEGLQRDQGGFEIARV